MRKVYCALCKDEAVVCSLVWRWRGEVEIDKVEPGRGKLSPLYQNSLKLTCSEQKLSLRNMQGETHIEP